MGDNPVRINALVDLLNTHDRAALEELRRKHPEHRDILAHGIVMGATSSKSLQAVYIDVALEGLRAAKNRVEPNLQRLRSRLHTAKRVRLIGQIIGAVTSAGLIAAILGGWERWVAVTTAVINFAAVLCTILAGYLETPPHGGKGNLIDSFETLTGSAVEAEEVIQTLQVLRRAPDGEPQLMEQIARANAVAGRLRVAERMLWGSS
jgi:uncharacterized membrane protein YkgB